ncbi:Histone acetyltransferase type B catalytic subunit [Capsicum annuum]|uniref:histone acetyltransferase n=1 Tax=Capsicum annuum TaxID=4072 RepID=A0A1U8E1X2_CAPAN|nr:histone acetyltransferase type B catalytic subunit [Capsicum annuum]KAF3647067.1 Histone acetyltransferase type B catalytic subunit [Capsicum annuum]KAF3649735.1 Histone acetyltransferase type B catalytic subunit [Capsicum annuum]PHT74267.1 Histone acetyltransferase type B catalytic subunit [Capsicum annuum]
MGTKHHSSSEPISDPQKRRRVGFSKTDAGIEANDCITIYTVSRKEDVDSPNSYCLEPIDLNHFFEDNGRIFGYQGLKITIWVSLISFHAYADIAFESSSDGGRGITNLKSALQNIFAESLVDEKDAFLQTFSTESHYVRSVVSNAEALQHKVSNGCSTESNCLLKSEPSGVEVFRIVGTPVGHFYSRLVPLVLLLVDGSNRIDVLDPRWEIYLLVQERKDNQEYNLSRLLGFAAVYRFHRYPESTRVRLGQILVMPPYQRKGYGRFLLEVLNRVAISEDVYDLTIEEPEDSLQHVRLCNDVERLLVFDPIQQSLQSVVSRLKQENRSKKSYTCKYAPPLSAVEDVRKTLKINKKQFEQCWEILIYLHLDPINKYMETYRAFVSHRVKAEVVGKDSDGDMKQVIDVPTEYNQQMSFVMFKSQNGESSSIEKSDNQSNVEEQLQKLVHERINQIKLIAEKVSVHRQ